MQGQFDNPAHYVRNAQCCAMSWDDGEISAWVVVSGHYGDPSFSVWIVPGTLEIND